MSQDVDLGDNETLSLKSDSTYWRNPGHLQVDSLAGVAPCRKCIDRALWLTQLGQESSVECKSISQPDWIPTSTESNNESLV